MDVQFYKDEQGFYQQITEIIHAEIDVVFAYLATNKISLWFPQLSYQPIDGVIHLVFDMAGEGPDEVMAILDIRQDEFLKFEWGDGYVQFTLEETENGTLITLDEFLTPLFPSIANDFTGWYYQMNNIRNISETDDPSPLDDFDFKTLEYHTAQALAALE
ncbi:SRPBCC family protein [Fundicoccus culcitae]|uniref:Uncharacterized protein n=1 Tax=Fundicoccus culcitae TaxID=2969821 RepID=A0ABY5P5Y3_9LACT|nr:hypothetical protein [Fundicoccus culcitae]UUX34122.1 hypothetical protein NRE15_00180 [Fundicoccus culcitae]